MYSMVGGWGKAAIKVQLSTACSRDVRKFSNKKLSRVSGKLDQLKIKPGRYISFVKQKRLKFQSGTRDTFTFCFFSLSD